MMNSRILRVASLCLAITLMLMLLPWQPTLAVTDSKTAVLDHQYVSTRFDIDLEQEWTAESFAEALAAVSSGNEIEVAESFSLADALQAAVTAANYLELALSYTPDKTDARLAAYDLESSSNTDIDRFIAAGLDAGLYDAETAAAALASSLPPDAAAVADLLYNVAEANGNTRHYLGYSDDAEIDARLNQLWDTFAIFEDEWLTEVGGKAVEDQIVTGFNLKHGAYDAHFDPALTLQYGHSSILHAHQLLVLLKSEDVRAKVALEPKISVYQYLIEWGEIGEPTPTYEVREVAPDFYLAYAVEYDLLFEFDSKEDMAQFDGIVREYAKKWEGNEDAVGLIADAWWQPLYTALRDDMPSDEYYKIHDCIVRNGDYRLHTFVLDETITETLEALQAIAPDAPIETVERFCNEAFHNYLTGADFQ